MKLRFMGAALCGLLVFAPTSLATAGAAGQGYGSGATARAASATGNTATGLPFTGFDLVLLVVGGLMLVVVGAGLRRAARRNT
jgi:hypothetical protein